MFLDEIWRNKMKMKKTSEVFREAKKHLNRGNQNKNDYICAAISAAKQSKLVTDKAAKRAMSVIWDRLNDYISVTSWLKERGFVHIYARPDNNVQIQKYRHRWLNALIKEFEAKGD
jgi:hypothetical protein